MSRAAGLLAGLLRYLLLLGVLGLLLLALYASLGRQLVPLLAEYRVEVEQRAEAALQMPVAIGRLEGQWSRLAPQLIANDVLLGAGADAVRLDQLRVVVDPFQSLWQRRPVLHAVEIEAPHLGLVQQPEGNWQVRGLPRREGQPPAEIGKILAGLQRLPRLTLYNGQLTIEPLDAEPHTLTYVDLQLSNRGQRMRLEGRALLPDGQPLALNLQARVNPESWQAATLEAYLNLPQSQWAEWIPAHLTRDWQLQSLRAGGEAWLHWRDRSLSRAVLRGHAAELRVAQNEREPETLNDLGLTAYLDRTDAGYRLLLDNLAFDRQGTRWGEARIGLAQTQDEVGGKAWQLWADRLEVGALVPLIQGLAPLPPVAGEWLAGLQPRGALQNLSVLYRPIAEGAERLHYGLNLAGVGFNDHGWVPAAAHVSGSIQGDLAGGVLRLDAEDASVHLARLFPEPWSMRHARGQIRWTVDEDAVSLIAPYLQVDSEVGQLAGDFLIRLRFDPAAEDYMDLRVGLREGDARFAHQFLPSRSPAMSAALTEWLQGAIQGGRVEQGYFQYQGALSGTAPAEARQIGLYLKVSDAELAYRPGWPNLRQARGEILMENGDTRVRLAEAQVLDSRVHDATAQVRRPAPGQAVRVDVQGQVQGPLSDGLRVLRDSPLGLEALFAGWEVEGRTDATLALDIPLQTGIQPRVVVDFAMEGATLAIPTPALRLEQLAGRFRYDTREGLSGQELRARLLGASVTGRAVAIGSPQHPATRIEAKGEIGLAELQRWLGAPQALPVSGRLPYRMALTLDGPNSQLRVDSDLRGVAVDLPEPYGKDVRTRRAASLQMTLQGSERHYWVDYAELARLAFAAPPGEWRTGRGELRLGGGSARLPTTPGLRVRGAVPVLDLAAWRSVLQQPGNGTSAERGAGFQLPALLRDAKLQIGRFQGFGTELVGLSAHLAQADGGWRLDLDSDRVTGRLSQKAGMEAPLVVALDSLRLPAAVKREPGSATTDPLAEVDPFRLPAMDIAIKTLWQGEERLGSLSTDLRPILQGARFSNIEVNLRGLHVTGAMTWGAARTHYQGWIEGGDIGDVLAAWGFARSATSERFGLNVDGSWPGSPGHFSFARISGRLEPSLRNGRFTEVEGGAEALRMFGLLNFNSIGRRLRLDFSDLLGRGLSYDQVHGVLIADAGVFVTRQPLVLKGPSSNLELDGTLDLATDRIDAKLLVTLPVTNNLPLAAILAGAPAVAGALWVADRVLGDRMARFATVQYDVEGPWQSPEITFDKPFEKPN